MCFEFNCYHYRDPSYPNKACRDAHQYVGHLNYTWFTQNYLSFYGAYKLEWWHNGWKRLLLSTTLVLMWNTFEYDLWNDISTIPGNNFFILFSGCKSKQYTAKKGDDGKQYPFCVGECTKQTTCLDVPIPDKYLGVSPEWSIVRRTFIIECFYVNCGD